VQLVDEEARDGTGTEETEVGEDAVNKVYSIS